MEHPYTAIVAGPTGCGKTCFIHKLIKSYNDYERIIYGYSMWQDVYTEMMKIKNVEMHEGFPEVQLDGRKTLLVLDDLMMENDKLLAKYFTRMRHANMSTIFVTQNFFHDSKYMRTITRNAHYLVLFENPRDNKMIKTLGMQIFPEHPNFIADASRQTSQKKYGYLFIDCKPNVEHRVKEGIFPDEEHFVYVPK